MVDKKKVVEKEKKQSPVKSAKITGYCLKCRAVKPLDSNFELIRKKIPNGNTVSILCGTCSVCKGKVCKIIANNKE
jgi:hypothetical protein